MNVQHSPKEDSSIGGSVYGSQPDLYTLSRQRDDNYVNLRKRKLPEFDHISKSDFDSFRIEMMAFLTEFSTTQKHETSEIRQSCSEIKDDIKTLKLATEQLTDKYGEIRQELTALKDDNLEIRGKIQNLEKDVQQLHITKSETGSAISVLQSSANPPLAYREDIITESFNRYQRMHNILVAGIVEINNKDKAAREHHDLDICMKVLKTVHKDCPAPVKVMRLGKYDTEKTRLTKLTFESTETVTFLLKNKTKNIGEYRIYSDQTPNQMAYMKTLRNELHRRNENGETNLTIKYIRGVPKIVNSENEPKNSNQ
jgi:hypothetical protein